MVGHKFLLRTMIMRTFKPEFLTPFEPEFEKVRGVFFTAGSASPSLSSSPGEWERLSLLHAPLMMR